MNYYNTLLSAYNAGSNMIEASKDVALKTYVNLESIANTEKTAGMSDASVHGLLFLAAIGASRYFLKERRKLNEVDAPLTKLGLSSAALVCSVGTFVAGYMLAKDFSK